LGVKCDGPAISAVRLAGDLKLYAAIKNHMTEFAQVALEAQLINNNTFQLSGVTLDDYKSIGATRDQARVCIQAASTTTANARKSIAVSVAASQVIQGISF
jgi:hypothetical protein